MPTPNDTDFQQYFGLTGQKVVVPRADVPAGIADAVKISHCFDGEFSGEDGIYTSGNENCIDVCRGGNLTIRKFVLQPGVQNAITLKGGVKKYLVEEVTLTRHSLGAQDIDLGNWSDYDKWTYVVLKDGTLQRYKWLRRSTEGILRRVKMQDGSPVRVRCMYADRPTIEDCNIEWVGMVPGRPELNPVLTAAYFTAKRQGWLSTRKPTDANAILKPEEIT